MSLLNPVQRYLEVEVQTEFQTTMQMQVCEGEGAAKLS